MSPSTKIILKILLFSVGGAALFGLMYLITGQEGHGFSKGMGNIAAFFAIIASVTFIAFLFALVLNSAKGK